MGEKRAFQTERAAVTGGPYSQAVIHNDLIYVSGMGAVDPESNEFRPGTIEEETELALENIRIVLEEAGSSLEKVLVFVSVYSQVNSCSAVWSVRFVNSRTLTTVGS